MGVKMKITWFKDLFRARYSCATLGCKSDGIKRSGKYPESMDVYVCEKHFLELTQDVISITLEQMEDKIVDKIIYDLAHYPDNFKICSMDAVLTDIFTGTEYWVYKDFKLYGVKYKFTFKNRERLKDSYKTWRVWWDVKQSHKNLTDIGNKLGVKFNDNKSDCEDFQNVEEVTVHHKGYDAHCSKLNRHIELHKNLDELISCFVMNTDELPSQTSMMKFMEWSYRQTTKHV